MCLTHTFVQNIAAINEKSICRHSSANIEDTADNKFPDLCFEGQGT